MINLQRLGNNSIHMQQLGGTWTQWPVGSDNEFSLNNVTSKCRDVRNMQQTYDSSSVIDGEEGKKAVRRRLG